MSCISNVHPAQSLAAGSPRNDSTLVRFVDVINTLRNALREAGEMRRKAHALYHLDDH